jgi:hypothetical protein
MNVTLRALISSSALNCEERGIVYFMAKNPIPSHYMVNECRFTYNGEISSNYTEWIKSWMLLPVSFLVLTIHLSGNTIPFAVYTGDLSDFQRAQSLKFYA